MSETKHTRANKKPNYTRRRLTALGAAGLAAFGIAKGVNLLESHPDSTNGVVREYIVQPGDTAWTIANRAFPDDAGDAERMFGVRQEIKSQLPMDEAHQDGMLQPGDHLVFDDEAKIGQEVQPEQATQDLPGRTVSGFENSYRGKDGRAHWSYDKSKARIVSGPIR